MRFVFLRCSLFALIAAVLPSPRLRAQEATATLREVHGDGLKQIDEPQLIALTGLTTGSRVGKSDLQSAADRLLACGYFSKVSYTFKTRPDGVVLTFQLEEAPVYAPYFDNFPWFTDAQLLEAISKRVPLSKPLLPGGGRIADEANSAIEDLLASHGVHLPVQHQITGSPSGEGNILDFELQNSSTRISSLEFSDPSLLGSKIVQQHLSDIVGKPFSRFAIDLFLTENIRPVYQQLGYLRAQLGPPQVRLAAAAPDKLPSDIPVLIPITPGSIYRWGGIKFSGNTVLSELTLTALIPLKSGDVANGQQLDAAWDRIREEYAHRGYLDANLSFTPAYDQHSATISYQTSIQEGRTFTFGKITVTGLSVPAEKKLRQKFPIQAEQLFDKTLYEDFLATLQTHPEQIFAPIPAHFSELGHWLQPDPAVGTVDVLLDFK